MVARHQDAKLLTQKKFEFLINVQFLCLIKSLSKGKKKYLGKEIIVAR